MVHTSMYGNIDSLTMAKRFMTIVDGSKKKDVASIVAGNSTICLLLEKGALLSGKIEMHWHDLSSLTTLTI